MWVRFLLVTTYMSPVAQSDRALNNETCKSLKQQVSSGLLNQRSQVRVLSGDFKKALAATLNNMLDIILMVPCLT